MDENPTVETPPKKGHAWVRLFVDWGGPTCFLLAYFAVFLGIIPTSDHRQAIMTGTWALLAGSVVALATGFLIEKRVAWIPMISGGAALVFGTLTLLFHDPRFLYMKPTIMNLAFASVMFWCAFRGKNPLKALFGDAIKMTDAGWRKLTVRYGGFFLFVAVLNEIVWRTQPEHIWVLFRMPGLLILPILFSISQVPAILKEARALEGAAELEG